MPTTSIATTLFPDPEGSQNFNPSKPNCVTEEDDLLKSSLEGPAENNYINLTNCLTSNIKESDFVPKAVSSPAETIPMAEEKKDPGPAAAFVPEQQQNISSAGSSSSNSCSSYKAEAQTASATVLSPPSDE